MRTLELYYNDLTPEAQAKYLKGWVISAEDVQGFFHFYDGYGVDFPVEF